jgi:methyl-accepting chemotaxis protein
MYGIGEKLLGLAGAHAGPSEADLRRWVSMSITANNGVRQVAEMTRSVREAHSRTHAIAAAVEEMSASIDEIASTSQAAAGDAHEAATGAQSSHVAAVEAVEVMEGIAASVQDAVAKVETLAEASTHIGEMVQDIEAIAKQTNLLALNATIEAARAGEAGKGFAVVAGEVKSLANQTATATDDIRSRIATLRTEMSVIVEAMREGANRAENGQSAIQATDGEIERLGGQIGAVSAKMDEIAAILHQQKEASREIGEGTSVISQMSENNVGSIDAVIETLEQSEAPIVEGINELVQKSVPNATIHAAKSDHLIWMRKLAQMLAGRASLNPNELADHHSCRLGKWYAAQTDERLQHHPAWKALLDPHRRVHQAGIEAARAHKAGDLETAISRVEEARLASVDVMKLLNELTDG